MANEQRMRPRKRKKVCAFCVDKVTSIDYKDTAKLRRYLSERGKILPRRTTGTCADISVTWPPPSSAPVRSPCCPTSLTDCFSFRFGRLHPKFFEVANDC